MNMKVRVIMIYTCVLMDVANIGIKIQYTGIYHY